MAADDTNQCFDYGATEDDMRAASSPVALLVGAWSVAFSARYDYDGYSVGTELYLASVETATDHAAFRLRRDATAGNWYAGVVVDGVTRVEYGEFRFSALQRMVFAFDGPGGTVSVAGSTDPGGGGDGIAYGGPWSLDDGAWRLGGNVVGSDVCEGYISLLYAMKSVPYIPSLDFSDHRNSQYVALL